MFRAPGCKAIKSGNSGAHSEPAAVHGRPTGAVDVLSCVAVPGRSSSFWSSIPARMNGPTPLRSSGTIFSRQSCLWRVFTNSHPARNPPKAPPSIHQYARPKPGRWSSHPSSPASSTMDRINPNTPTPRMVPAKVNALIKVFPARSMGCFCRLPVMSQCCRPPD